MPAQCLGFLNGPFFGTNWTRFLCTVRSTRWIACGTSSERSRVKCRVQLVEDVGEARRKIWAWTKTVPWGLHVHADYAKTIKKYLHAWIWMPNLYEPASICRTLREMTARHHVAALRVQIHICRMTWNLVQQWWKFNLCLQENWVISYTS